MTSIQLEVLNALGKWQVDCKYTCVTHWFPVETLYKTALDARRRIKNFAFPFPAWLDQIYGQMDWESRTKKNGHREDRILLGCDFLLAEMDKKWVYLTTPRTPDEQYQKTWGTFVVVPAEFKDRFSVFHTALSSKGTCARKILSQCWNLTRNGNARALKCRHSYSTSNTALQSRDMAWNITNLPENHPVYESPKITHTQTHINIWMYAYIHTYTHIHTYVHTYISYIHTNMHTYIHT